MIRQVGDPDASRRRGTIVRSFQTRIPSPRSPSRSLAVELRTRADQLDRDGGHGDHGRAAMRTESRARCPRTASRTGQRTAADRFLAGQRSRDRALARTTRCAVLATFEQATTCGVRPETAALGGAA